jgi:hypothetical protein
MFATILADVYVVGMRFMSFIHAIRALVVLSTEALLVKVIIKFIYIEDVSPNYVWALFSCCCDNTF